MAFVLVRTLSRIEWADYCDLRVLYSGVDSISRKYLDDTKKSDSD